MDTAQWPQIQGVVKSVETYTSSSKRVVKESCMPQKEQLEALVLKCPRCNSSNTKFCYNNNYSLSQPRYLCKTCRRYWTVGGSLRNIPVGGNARKSNKRSSSSCIISQSSSKKLLLSAAAHHASTQNLKIEVQDHECQHLHLGFSESSTISNDFKTISQLIQVPNFDTDNIIGNKCMQTISPNNSSSTSHDFSGLELSTGIHSSTSFLSMLSSITSSTNFDHPSPTLYSSTVSLSGSPLVTDHQLIKPITSSATLHLSWDQNELGVSTTSIAGSQGKVLFPFEDLKVEASNNTSTPNTSTSHDSNEQQNEGVWKGMIGTAGSW